MNSGPKDPSSGGRQISAMARQILLGIVTYGLWLLAAALGLWVVLELRQFLLIDFPIMVLMPLGFSRYWQRTADRFGVVILGLLWLIFVVASNSVKDAVMNA